MTEQRPMRMRTKVLLGAVALSLCGVTAFSYLTDAHAEQQHTIDDGVRTIRLSGVGAALRLETSGAGDGQVLVETEDKRGCGLEARLEGNADSLEIIVERAGAPIAWWCEPKVSVVLPESLNLAIALDDLAADLSGRFRNVAIESKRSAIHFEGRAEQFALTGDAAAVDLNFASDMRRDAIHLNVKQLLSQISFAGA